MANDLYPNISSTAQPKERRVRTPILNVEASDGLCEYKQGKRYKNNNSTTAQKRGLQYYIHFIDSPDSVYAGIGVGGGGRCRSCRCGLILNSDMIHT